MLLLITFDPSVIYECAAFLAIVIGGVATYFKNVNAIEILKNDLQNEKDCRIKLEAKVELSQDKIERKIGELEDKMEIRHKELNDKIDALPNHLADLFKGIMLK